MRKINNSYTLGQSNAPTNAGDMLKTRDDGTPVWEGVDDTTFVPVTWYGGRGVFAGGYAAGWATLNTIDYITISSTGNATDFGDMTGGKANLASCSSGTRGLFIGGYVGGGLNNIDYITISTAGNAADFGDLLTAAYGTAACSDGDRGVIMGGGSPKTNVIQYVTIASTGNAIDFGDLIVAKEKISGACSNGVRGVTGGGQVALSPYYSDTIEYITIATTGNATDFGNLTAIKTRVASCSNDTRGIFAGAKSPSYSNVIEYITIATTGNATDFGDLTTATGTMGSCSDGTKGVFGGGDTGYGVPVNVVEYITIATTGNTTDFGDLTITRSELAACSGD